MLHPRLTGLHMETRCAGNQMTQRRAQRAKETTMFVFDDDPATHADDRLFLFFDDSEV